MTGLPFTDTGLPVADRVNDLLSRLTLAEKVGLLHQRQAPVPRLGIAEFRTGTEALHGLAWLGPATVFPQAVGLATSWDPELVKAVGAAVGDEVRGFHHKDPARGGLNVWAPVVNPLRDPRWGRNEEGYAEDSWLTAVMATAYASGLRGDHPRYLKTAPTLKHFLGYNNETDRDRTSSNLSPRVLHEYELPAYRMPLETGAAVAVMGSYNLVNGRPAQLSPLINQQLRQWAGDDLLVVSDAHAPSNLVNTQHYFDDHTESHAAALRAGLDSFTDQDGQSEFTVGRLTEALDRGLISESDVDAAVRRILTLRFRLGEFDPPEANPYAGITEEVINCPAHQALAREAARRSIVLLTHRGLLPLRPEQHRTVAVIGPLADAVHADWYSGTLPYAVTARAGLVERLGADAVRWCEGAHRVALRIHGTDDQLAAGDDPTEPAVRLGTAAPAIHFDLIDWGGGSCVLRSAASGRHLRVDEQGVLVADSPGPNGWVVRETFRLVERVDRTVALRNLATDRYLLVNPDGTVTATATGPDQATGFVVELVASGETAAAQVAAEADVAIVVLGNHPMVNGRETEDRADLALPAEQEALLKAVHAANPNTVLVVASSYPYALGWADENLPAVLWSAHGGQEYGHALVDVLFGDADPGGRLTQTWYRSAADLPDLFDYDIIGNDATYLYYRGTPVYPFGHGLSYTSFGYENLRLSADELAADGAITVSVDVVNTGDRPGDEVVQLYTHQLRSRVKQPVRALRGFARVSLAPGERTTVTLPLRAADLAFWDVTSGRPVVEAARHRVMVGRSATDVAVSAIITVHGDQIPPRSPTRLRAVDYDDCYGVTLADESPTAGDTVRAVEPAGWLEFRQVDLSAEPTALRVRAARTAADPAAVTLRRDDPLAGSVLATVTVPPTGSRHRFTELTAAVTGASGVTDLYLVFDQPDTIVAEVALG
ncbi:MAG TPA: glycoside hydrolase family 3 C-terminal domain-containing protein [Natronosporangium sp.]